MVKSDGSPGPVFIDLTELPFHSILRNHDSFPLVVLPLPFYTAVG